MKIRIKSLYENESEFISYLIGFVYRLEALNGIVMFDDGTIEDIPVKEIIVDTTDINNIY